MSLNYLPTVKLIYATPLAEKIVASSAKATLSPKDFTEISENMESSDIGGWIKELIARGHGSPLEHCLYVYEVVCSRVTSHQLVRHRHASYSQLSQRYSDKYLKKLVIKACELAGVDYRDSYELHADVLSRVAKSHLEFNALLDLLGEAFIIPPSAVEKQRVELLKSLLEYTANYYRALSMGIPHEDARYILPQAVKTRVVVSMNARELVEVFLPLRMCNRAQWEIRMIAWSLWQQLVRAHPLIFWYTGPRCVLYENRAGEKTCTLREYLVGEATFTISRCPERVPRDQMRSCLKRAQIDLPS
ncbi:MAG: FAD-dependent thymidylate synthase [Desulfurococcaceae archaeon]